MNQWARTVLHLLYILRNQESEDKGLHLLFFFQTYLLEWSTGHLCYCRLKSTLKSLRRESGIGIIFKTCI